MSSNLAQFLHQKRFLSASIVMNIPEVRQSTDDLIALLFPERGCIGKREETDIFMQVTKLKKRFKSYVESVSVLDPKLKGEEENKVEAFFEELLEIVKILDTDALAAFSGDPAAYSKEEVIITYPGFYAVCVHRLAHSLHNLGIPLLPRLLSEYAHEKTGIDIHPGAKIGESFFIDHGTAVVIGETANIGKNVKIYQGVTLGALSVKKKMQSRKRHPTIEDDVVIYASSTILGGDTVIGASSVIGGNTWIVESVPKNSVVMNQTQTKVSGK